jgi:hypothetical protein
MDVTPQAPFERFTCGIPGDRICENDGSRFFITGKMGFAKFYN